MIIYLDQDYIKILVGYMLRRVLVDYMLRWVSFIQIKFQGLFLDL
jgi:hypothetical protein